MLAFIVLPFVGTLRASLPVLSTSDIGYHPFSDAFVPFRDQSLLASLKEDLDYIGVDTSLPTPLLLERTLHSIRLLEDNPQLSQEDRLEPLHSLLADALSVSVLCLKLNKINEMAGDEDANRTVIGTSYLLESDLHGLVDVVERSMAAGVPLAGERKQRFLRVVNIYRARIEESYIALGHPTQDLGNAQPSDSAELQQAGAEHNVTSKQQTGETKPLLAKILSTLLVYRVSQMGMVVMYLRVPLPSVVVA
ncbi:hypothetical protein CVT26_001118 [Gymnopilus dilepis]|uniref:Uncharacterized protein n=1 Tax=Gymnopilus dilepis TaxID=231916 RepID=A0A409W7H8_9AGAR|nr:hypothetical protein CVT26_001118 [Gymnopilus dilepis]